MVDYNRFLEELGSVTSHLGSISAQGDGASAKILLVPGSGTQYSFEGTVDDVLQAVMRTDADGLYPGEDSSSLTTKLKLFSVHVEEALDTAPAGATQLSIRSYGVVAT